MEYWIVGAVLVALVAYAARKQALCAKKDEVEAKVRLASAKAEHDARLTEAARLVAEEKRAAAAAAAERERLVVTADDVVDAEFGADGGLRRVRKLPRAVSAAQMKSVEECKETVISAHGVTLRTGRGAVHVLADAEKVAAEALGGGHTAVARTGWEARLEEARAARVRAEADLRRPSAIPTIAPATTLATTTPPDLSKQLAELQRNEELGKRNAPPLKEERKGGEPKEKEAARTAA
jgi:hypothetical protein